MASVTRVVAYDISDDRRRARAAALLQAHGDRLQESVYLVIIDQGRFRELMDALTATVSDEEDSVFAFAQCHDCWESRVQIGLARPPKDVRYWCAV